ncbi:MAG: VPLPA-CTERM sorting domain-containing protein [Pseudomonadota bacterium]
MRFFALSAACSFCFLAGAAHSSPVTFDFNEFNNGDLVATISKDGIGATVSASKTGSQVDTGASACDTTLPFDSGKCDDPDLVAAGNSQSEALGSVLVVQESGTASGDPLNFGFSDDNFNGGTLTFTFDTMVKLLSVDILDIESGTTLSVTMDGIALTAGGAGSDGISGDSLFETFLPTNMVFGDALVFTANSSYGIDNLTVQAVPVPAAIPLLLASLGGFGVVRRSQRRRKTSTA